MVWNNWVKNKNQTFNYFSSLTEGLTYQQIGEFLQEKIMHRAEQTIPKKTICKHSKSIGINTLQISCSKPNKLENNTTGKLIQTIIGYMSPKFRPLFKLSTQPKRKIEWICADS